MKQQIGYAGDPNRALTDEDVVFAALYNLLYEKTQEEPKKGIIASKGNPNQRKVSWSKVLRMAHMMEDFFILRRQRYGEETCQTCRHWESISEVSPWMGACKKYTKRMHAMEHCKKWRGSS